MAQIQMLEGLRGVDSPKSSTLALVVSVVSFAVYLYLRSAEKPLNGCKGCGKK